MVLHLFFLGGGRRALTSFSTLRRGKDGSESRVGERAGRGGVGENEGNGDADDAEEKDAVQSFVSISSEKETKESWPPLFLSLRDVMMDCTNN